MIKELLIASFPIFRQVEGYPTCHILEREVTNDPFESPHRSNIPYEYVLRDVECVFSRMDARTDLGDNVINTNTSFYFIEDVLGGISLGTRHIIEYKNEYYKPTPGGVTNDFGLVEARVTHGN